MSRVSVLDTRRIADWRAAIGRVRKAYRDYFGRAPRLMRPRLYSEKMQWRKLFDLDPRYAVLSDKLAARDFIAETVGAEFLPELLLVTDDPDNAPFETLEPPYLLKGTHGSGDVMRIRAASDVNLVTRTLLRRALAHCHGTRYDEPGYVPVPRRILAERMIVNRDGTPPLERRMFVFGGTVRLTQTVVPEAGALRSAGFHQRDWTRLPWHGQTKPFAGPMPRPARLDEMVALAERLGQGFDHLRVDLYEADDRVYVGELTLYSWGGLMYFTTEEPDRTLGAYWELRHPLTRAAAAVLLRERRIATDGQRPSA